MLEIRKNGDTDPWKQYVYHPEYVDSIAIRYYDENTDGAGIVEHYYLQDANFNVTAVTDDTGAVVERYAYTPYGEVTVLDADFSDDADGKSDIDNEYRYTGRRLDPETGLQLNRNRFYHPQLGRWVNRDPIGYDGSKWNLYEYVNGMPIGSLDPIGLAVVSFEQDFGSNSTGIVYGTLAGNWVFDCIKNTSKVDLTPGLTGFTGIGGRIFGIPVGVFIRRGAHYGQPWQSRSICALVIF